MPHRRHAYLAAISFCDAQVGRLLDAYENSPERENTIPCFWSDHGWSLGEKEHWRKFALWEETTRMPFIWVAPGVTKPGGVCVHPVDLMSIYPTLCALVEIPKPAHVTGENIRPLLADPAGAWTAPAMTTFHRDNHAIRHEQYRYIRYADGGEELYDHATDENEWTNLDVPAFDGIGANEFIMQVTHEVPGLGRKLEQAVDFISTMNTSREAEWNIWYHVMNCGFPIVASGETDFPCMSGERVGMGRVYMKLDGRLDYDRWVEALRRGVSYVSDGTSHLLDFEQKADGTFAVKAAVRLPDEPDVEVEWIVNGYPGAAQKVKADGTMRELTFAPKLERSSWVAARISPSTHTNPVWVKVDGKPVRDRQSAEWCLASLERAVALHPEWSVPAEGVFAADDLATLSDAVRQKFQQRFWNTETGRFVG